MDFEDVLAEPDGMRSYKSVWRSNRQVYTAISFGCYRLLSLILGIPCSILWALYFAKMNFFGVWCFIPTLKALSLPVSDYLLLSNSMHEFFGNGLYSIFFG